jgi:peptide/nickel transport system permease protein
VWLVIFPGVTIFVTVLAANLFGNAVRDAFDPRLR